MQSKENVIDRAKKTHKQKTTINHTPDTENALEPTDLLAVIDAVVQQQPAEIANNTRVGYELGLDVGHPWHDGRLSMFWLVTPEELDTAVDGFTTLRRALEQLDIVKHVAVEIYIEPESSGFISEVTNDLVELVGERWAVEFVNPVRYTHPWMDNPCSACSSVGISSTKSERGSRSTSHSLSTTTTEVTSCAESRIELHSSPTQPTNIPGDSGAGKSVSARRLVEALRRSLEEE